jgi:hypothetical protein
MQRRQVGHPKLLPRGVGTPVARGFKASAEMSLKVLTFAPVSMVKATFRCGVLERKTWRSPP